MNNTETAIAAIALVEDRDELLRIFDACKQADDRIRRNAVRAYSKGDTVEFDLKSGSVARGTVDKINRKTVGVTLTHIDGEERPYGGGYNVPASLLRAVASV